MRQDDYFGHLQAYDACQERGHTKVVRRYTGLAYLAGKAARARGEALEESPYGEHALTAHWKQGWFFQ